MRPRTLTVHLDDVPVATFTGTRPGRVSCAYLGAAFEMAGLTAPLLSCSLPLRRGRGAAYPFASGLLPEGVHRQVMAGIAGVPTHDVIGMLARFGRDVAGALVITEGDLEHRPPPSVEPYDEHGLDRAVAELSDHPLGLYDDSELSIAGLADKMLLARTPDGGFGRPRHGAASTHILKVDDRTRRGLVRAEHACLALARDVDLAAAHSTVLRVGDTDCIVVTRYDREVAADGSVRRIHQEDACQALGIDPEDNRRRAKYQSAGGPGWRDVAALLNAYADDPLVELGMLLDYATFTTLVGNADAHGKNLSLVHPSPGSIALAPLYDVVPTMLWPGLRTEAAMSVNGVWSLPTIIADDLAREARSWGFSARESLPRVRRLAEAVREHAAEGLTTDADELPLVRGLGPTVLRRAEQLLAD